MEPAELERLLAKNRRRAEIDRADFDGPIGDEEIRLACLATVALVQGRAAERRFRCAAA